MEQLSAARAHILVQEELAAYAPGEGFTGVCSRLRTKPYPRDLYFEITVPVGDEYGSKVATSPMFEVDDNPTEDDVRALVRQSVDACRKQIAERAEKVEATDG